MALLYEIQYSDRESVHYYCQLHKTCVVWLLIFSFYIFRSIKSYYESRGSNAINSEYKKTVELAEQESSGSKCCGRWQQETAITWVLLNLTHLSFSLSYVATLWLLPRYSFFYQNNFIVLVSIILLYQFAFVCICFTACVYYSWIIWNFVNLQLFSVNHCHVHVHHHTRVYFIHFDLTWPLYRHNLLTWGVCVCVWPSANRNKIFCHITNEGTHDHMQAIHYRPYKLIVQL